MHALHLCMDHNFVTDSRKRFEQYYPGQNTFVVYKQTSELEMIKNPEGFIVMNLDEKENYARILQICREKGVDRIVMHGVLGYMLELLEYLKCHIEFKIYWVFWGYELYEALTYERNYHSIDDGFSPFHKLYYFIPNKVSKFLRKSFNRYRAPKFVKIFSMADYFCFWNVRDYELLKRNFETNAEFRFFSYGANTDDSMPADLFELRERTLRNVMIDHQASVYGNHRTVFRRLRKIDRDNRLNKITPLSYGHPMIRDRVLAVGRRPFGGKFKPVLDYMSCKEYFKMLDSIDVAIFGQRRQEASGNIIQLLKNGVKVFLRNDNNLLDYYREKGYIIFSFEDDLKDMESMTPLSLDEQRHNREVFLANRMYYDDFMPNLFEK